MFLLARFKYQHWKIGKSLVIKNTAEARIWSDQMNLCMIILTWNGDMPLTSDPRILFRIRKLHWPKVKQEQQEKQLTFSSY